MGSVRRPARKPAWRERDTMAPVQIGKAATIDEYLAPL